jgi:hypothetical protein
MEKHHAGGALATAGLEICLLLLLCPTGCGPSSAAYMNEGLANCRAMSVM